MGHNENETKPFGHSDLLFHTLAVVFAFNKNGVHALQRLFTGARSLDNLFDNHPNKHNLYRVIRKTIHSSIFGEHDSVVLDQPIDPALSDGILHFQEGLNYLKPTQKTKILHNLRRALVGMEIESEMSLAPLEQSDQTLRMRHIYAILPFLDMAAICLYDATLSDKELHGVAADIAQHWGELDYLEDYSKDSEHNIVHFSNDLLQSVGITSLEELRFMTETQFLQLKSLLLPEFKDHLNDIMKVTSWPLVFRLALQLFFISRLHHFTHMKYSGNTPE